MSFKKTTLGSTLILSLFTQFNSAFADQYLQEDRLSQARLVSVCEDDQHHLYVTLDLAQSQATPFWNQVPNSRILFFGTREAGLIPVRINSATPDSDGLTLRTLGFLYRETRQSGSQGTVQRTRESITLSLNSCSLRKIAYLQQAGNAEPQAQFLSASLTKLNVAEAAEIQGQIRSRTLVIHGDQTPLYDIEVEQSYLDLPSSTHYAIININGHNPTTGAYLGLRALVLTPSTNGSPMTYSISPVERRSVNERESLFSFSNGRSIRDNNQAPAAVLNEGSSSRPLLPTMMNETILRGVLGVTDFSINANPILPELSEAISHYQFSQTGTARVVSSSTLRSSSSVNSNSQPQQQQPAQPEATSRDAASEVPSEE